MTEVFGGWALRSFWTPAKKKGKKKRDWFAAIVNLLNACLLDAIWTPYKPKNDSDTYCDILITDPIDGIPLLDSNASLYVGFIPFVCSHRRFLSSAATPSVGARFCDFSKALLVVHLAGTGLFNRLTGLYFIKSYPSPISTFSSFQTFLTFTG